MTGGEYFLRWKENSIEIRLIQGLNAVSLNVCMFMKIKRVKWGNGSSSEPGWRTYPVLLQHELQYYKVQIIQKHCEYEINFWIVYTEIEKSG